MSWVWLLRRFRRVLLQPQPRPHGWTWRGERKWQLRLTVWTSKSSQVTSRCLFQKHPDFLFVQRKEEREERKFQEDDGDTGLLVRGLRVNTMVVLCESGWTARDLSDSLRVRTTVPVHLFYLVVEGRVLDCDELVRNLGRDRVVSTRGRVLGGSRNVSPIPGEWTCPGCLRSGCWPTKNTCFRCGTARPNSPLPPGPVSNKSRPARAPREQRHPGRVPGNATSLFCSISFFGAFG